MSQIALANDFLLAFSKVSKSHQKKVREFIDKFQANPLNPGQNLEKLTTKSGHLYSARVDQAYRVILVKAPKGDLFILAWVDHHDEAYAWADRHDYHVNPNTGALQVVNSEHVNQSSGPKAEVPESLPSQGEVDSRLFEHLKDRELLRLGVPESMLPAVRTVGDEKGLDLLEKHLPQEAYEALYFIYCGDSYESVVNELESPKEPKIDTEDFASALAHPNSKRRFYVVEDALELQEMLNAPLEQWRVFLHPSQRKLVEKKNFNGPVRVLGGPGTGKTVVAMHRAKFLAQKVFNDRHDKILLLTFTKNLAADIQHQLYKICPPEVMARIEVANIDHWVSEFLRQHQVHTKALFGDSDEHREFWDNAYNVDPTGGDLSREFYREEWEEVIQAQGLKTCQEYVTAPRTGRGRTLSRAQKKEIWIVFEEYRSQLNESGLKEFIDLTRDARELMASQKFTLPYRAVIVDEAQDMGSEAFKLIRAIVPATHPGTGEPSKNDLFLVGDAHQRIYRHKVALGKCGIDIRGRGQRLKINYRTTDEIRQWAMNLLNGVSVDDLDGEQDSLKGYKSLMHGPSPEIIGFDNFDAETEEIVQRVLALQKDEVELERICLVARTNKLIQAYQRVFEAKAIPCQVLKRNASDDSRFKGLRLATMHRAKGLEFDHVFIGSVNRDIVPLKLNSQTFDNETSREEYGTIERALLYVSVTRAKRSVTISYYGQKSSFLE